MWNEIIENSIKINTYQNKVWGRNNMYTRVLNITFSTLVKEQIKQIITQVTINEEFKKIFSEEMLIPHSNKALEEFQIDLESFI